MSIIRVGFERNRSIFVETHSAFSNKELRDAITELGYDWEIVGWVDVTDAFKNKPPHCYNYDCLWHAGGDFCICPEDVYLIDDGSCARVRVHCSDSGLRIKISNVDTTAHCKCLDCSKLRQSRSNIIHSIVEANSTKKSSGAVHLRKHTYKPTNDTISACGILVEGKNYTDDMSKVTCGSCKRCTMYIPGV